MQSLVTAFCKLFKVVLRCEKNSHNSNITFTKICADMMAYG